MSMLAQTDDSDLAITDNGFTVIGDDSEIRQRIINELRSFFREWFLDLTLGVPWFQLVFVKGTSVQVIDGLIKDTVLAVPGVISMEEYRPLDLNAGTRLLSVNFRVRTVNSTSLRIEEVLP